jgi:hypothetical protein
LAWFRSRPHLNLLTHDHTPLGELFFFVFPIEFSVFFVYLISMASRGAPKGNTNALKHGLYSSRVDPAILPPSALEIDLTPEISLLRSVINDFIEDPALTTLDLGTIDTLSSIILRLASICKAHSMITGLSSSDLSSIISSSIAELMDHD